MFNYFTTVALLDGAAVASCTLATFLAANAVALDTFFVVSAHCCPNRACMIFSTKSISGKQRNSNYVHSLTTYSGGVTDEDVETVMRLGGSTCRPEITYNELPAALGIVMALKAANFQLKDLFDRHDLDKVGL